ncbi:cyclin-like protein [Apodospora peruviana]|uniref:Cyclin-like protein n=1 Tax=Apodospora peruviana TaxID=516989 RepID=A0AAE0MB59_9PEZI|nr:cyclin-like protein [Apodospora peruviana]
MNTTGALNAPPKRTAFGDVSNMARAFGEAGAKDTLQTRVKSVVAAANSRGLHAEDKENSRAAAKATSSKAAISGQKHISVAPVPATSSGLPTKLASRGNFGIHPPVKQGVSKKTTTVYCDDKLQGAAVRPLVGSSVDDLITFMDKQTKNPRHYKSQPQLKTDQPILRRTQSKYIDKLEQPLNLDDADGDVADDVTEAAYEDAVERFPTDYEDSVPDDVAAAASTIFKHGTHVEFETEPQAVQYADTARYTKTFSSAPSEPEEYWDDDEEQDLYDEQGYTTAHSYKSHGDNTTGGVTTLIAPKITASIQNELELARSMVAEYSEDIFEYYRSLEAQMLPNPHYMDIQNEIQWSMRSVLMDWLVQVHNRFALLPETLFLTVNYIDRFLSVKVVSLAKLQLVGATAILVAAKYEEINCPSVQEIVYMVDQGFTCEEILKAERFMLSMLQFELGWPGPMSFLRRISKADDYDLKTRTLAKYFLEVTIMDERFVGSTPSYLAAGAHCLSRLILGKGDWTLAHAHYAGYTMDQLRPLIVMIYQCCQDPRKHHGAVFDKYSSSKYDCVSRKVEDKVRQGWTVPLAPALSMLTSTSALDDNSHAFEYNRMSLLIPTEG